MSDQNQTKDLTYNKQFENLTENFSEKKNKTNKKKKTVHEINPNYFILLTATVFLFGGSAALKHLKTIPSDICDTFTLTRRRHGGYKC